MTETLKNMQMIIDLIPLGHEHAISRERLCNRSGLSDREVRRVIGELNEAGNVILNRGEGYFRYDAETDRYYLEHYLAIENGRIRTLNRKLRKMRKAAGL